MLQGMYTAAAGMRADDAMAARIAPRRARLASARLRRDDATALAAREAEARGERSLAGAFGEPVLVDAAARACRRRPRARS